MKIKTSNLTGAQLDWAVAKCEGKNVELIGVENDDDPNKFWHNDTNQFYKFSTNWAVGGPIIGREGIRVGQTPTYNREKNLFELGGIVAYYPLDLNLEDPPESSKGKTYLEAAMRCYVASKLGDEIEIPEELCK